MLCIFSVFLVTVLWPHVGTKMSWIQNSSTTFIWTVFKVPASLQLYMYVGARHHPLVCQEGAAWMKKMAWHQAVAEKILLISCFFSTRWKTPLLTSCQNVPQTRSQSRKSDLFLGNLSNLTCVSRMKRHSKTTTGFCGDQNVKWKESEETLWPQICSGSTKKPNILHSERPETLKTTASVALKPHSE